MEKGEFSITKHTVECYKIRHSSGMYWADIHLDWVDRKGSIMIRSDYGNYSSYWGAAGPSFPLFLTGINMYYAADNFGCGNFIDTAATIKGIKEEIIRARRDRAIDNSDARKAWEEAENLTERTGEELVGAIWNCNYLFKVYDRGPTIEKGVHPLFVKFWNGPWQKFIEEIKKEYSE